MIMPNFKFEFLPRDAMQSAVIRLYVVCLSITNSWERSPLKSFGVQVLRYTNLIIVNASQTTNNMRK